MHRTHLRTGAIVLVTVIAALAGLLGVTTAAAEDFWCGDRIISNGMTTGQVLAACGKPVEVRVRPSGHHHHYINGYANDEIYDPPGELWTYNFGSSRLMQRLLFVNGVLAETTTLSFGYDN